MRRAAFLRQGVSVLLLGLGAVAPPPRALAQSAVGQIDGSTALVGIRGVTVAPGRREDTTTLTDAGTIDAEGYETIVLNLAGQFLGGDDTGGDVGVMLIPDIAPFDKAFSVANLLPTPLELSVTVSSRNSPYFMAAQKKFDVGFPRYRVLLYNTTKSPVSASFFAYRAH
jgi:hypothetical protein